MMQCQICGLILLTLKLYVSHLRLVHAKDPAFSIMCGVSGCREVFRAFSAFSSHIYRHHRKAIGVAQPDSSPDRTESPAFPICSASDYEFETEAAAECDFPAGNTTISKSGDSGDVKDKAAKFLLGLREGRQISQAAITDVISGCKSLCQHTIMTIKGKVQDQLVEAGIELPGFSDIFDADYNPFCGVDTNHLFEKYCIEHLGCLVSH